MGAGVCCIPPVVAEEANGTAPEGGVGADPEAVGVAGAVEAAEALDGVDGDGAPVGAAAEAGVVLAAAGITPGRRSNSWGSRSPRRSSNSLPACSEDKARAKVPPQGPRASGRQSTPKGDTTTAPCCTTTRVRASEAETVKSVPRMPMAATGVFRRNLSRAACAPEPEDARMTPLSSTRRMRVAPGWAGLNSKISIRARLSGRMASRPPSVVLMCRWPPGLVLRRSPSNTLSPTRKARAASPPWAVAKPMVKVTSPAAGGCGFSSAVCAHTGAAKPTHRANAPSAHQADDRKLMSHIMRLRLDDHAEWGGESETAITFSQ